MVLSFSRLGRYGRLGNTLFQWASTVGLAEKHNAIPAFPEWEYEKYFETPLSHGPMQEKQMIEKDFRYHDWGITESCDILGYLQSEKYFNSFLPRLKPEFVEKQKAKLSVSDKPVICLHIRRGDYVSNPNYYHIPPEFYLNALENFFASWRDSTLLFLSDDIEYARIHFGCIPNAHFIHGSDIEDLALASACDHFIISNSSFGWWCARLGEKPHSRIVHCGRLHEGKLARKGVEDYYPGRWIEHKKESYKINLRDLTFMIPVFHDHQYRRENLDLCLDMLQGSFDTNVIVCEQGGNRFSYLADRVKYMRANYPFFHRTRMLNDMARQAQTPYIANWDCDVIVPPAQILEALVLLKEGCDMAYPYGGPFARMPRNPWYAKIKTARDIGVVGREPFRGRERDHNSVGGAVMFNWESYFAAGGENENMKSFGPEDWERYFRFLNLGYQIGRVAGILFHVNHYVGVNSSPRNPHFEGNNRELEKIRALDSVGLRDYVESWKWRK